MSDNVVAFYNEDDIKAHVTDTSDGDTLIIVGVEGEKAFVLPVALFMHVVQLVDDACAKAAILIQESMTATKH
jgi:hypothetical protein